MTWRSMERDQAWLLPPSLNSLLPDDHPARFVAGFVDGLSRADWAELGVDLSGDALGAPAYHPRALLSIWLYGFMTGVRSSRKLEAACRDQLPYLWLTGNQFPDHNTLWRFYKAHRERMRVLLKHTVRTALHLKLIDLAVQAVDGTKIAGNASGSRTYDAASLERLLARTERVIAELEAQNEGGGNDPPPPRLPEELREAERLREQVQAALAELEEEDRRHANLTDPDARLLRGKDGYVTGYNAQAMAVEVEGADGSGGLLVTAAEVTQDASDNGQLLPMMDAAAETSGAGDSDVLTLADAGYFSGANLAECAERGAAVAVPEPGTPSAHPYHYSHFVYDPAADRYTCPEGAELTLRRVRRRGGHPLVRIYGARGSACRACPAWGVCTRSKLGRRIEVSAHGSVLQAHRRWMETEEARSAFRLRKRIVEPVFGIMKEQQGARRFLLRGLSGVRSEWSLLAVAFNLRTLWKARGMRGPLCPLRGMRVLGVARIVGVVGGVVGVVGGFARAGGLLLRGLSPARPLALA